MSVVDLAKWAKTNIWRLPSGEMCVRPGLRQIAAVATVSGLSDRALCGGFTIPNAKTGETWHYCLTVDVSGGVSRPTDLRLHIVDEDFAIFQTFAFGISVRPRGFSYARVFDEILMGSPDTPTLWGMHGNAVRYAVKEDSDSASTAIDIPRGIWTSWNNRAVTCLNDVMSVSDPTSVGGGTIRSFIGENQNQRPGAIFGIHEGARGMLIACTSAGVYGLDSAASATGQVGSNGSPWRFLSDLAIFSYDSSCVVDGRVFVLTKDGYALADVENGDAEALTEPYQPRAYGKRISLADFRAASLLAGEHGPICVVSDQNAAHFSDLESGLTSWWTSALTTFQVEAVLHDVDGTDLLMLPSGIYRVEGDFDGDTTTLTSSATQPTGMLFGQIPGAPSQNRLVRHVSIASDVGAGGSLHAAVRGKAQPSTSGTAGVSDPDGIVIGTDSWGTTSKRYTTSRLASVEVDFGEADCAAGDDVGVEVGSDVCLSRILPVVEVDPSDSAAGRPGKKG